MLVFADGRAVGTIGGGCYENDAIGRARTAIADGRSAVIKYDLNDDFAQENGLICGGQMEVHIDPLQPDPHLYIVGAGHVGFELGRIASAADIAGPILFLVSDLARHVQGEILNVNGGSVLAG